MCGAQRQGAPEGVTCKNPAGARTDHLGTGPCWRHLGNTKNHVKAGQREMARQACAMFGIGRTDSVDPAQALMGEVSRTVYAVEWYEQRIAALATADVPDLEEIAAHRDLWMAERKHLGDVTKKASDAGVAMRHIEMQEDLVRRVVRVLDEYTKLMGLDPSSPQAKAAGRRAFEIVAANSNVAAIDSTAREVG